jgi:hypothetical protein
MADLSDCTAAISSIVSGAVYPNGLNQPSVVGIDVRIFEGWPIPAQLDADMTAGKANISIFPMQGAQSSVFQILDETYVIKPAAHGMFVSVIDTSVTLTGVPGATEYCTLVIDGQNTFSRTGPTAGAIVSALLADLGTLYPGSSLSGSVLTIAGPHTVTARIGAQGTLGIATHRQKQAIMVSAWAPTPQIRTTLSAASDIALKNNIRVPLPDTSQMKICYNRTNVVDTWESTTVYRRDLIFDVEYATVYQFPGYEVTGVPISIDTPVGTVESFDPVLWELSRAAGARRNVSA